MGYRSCAEAGYVAVLDESGSLLLDSGDLAQEKADVIGALANGAFIAVRELASRLGDDSCAGLYHQGRTHHFYIAPLDDTTFLLTVFGNETKLGIVRSALAQYAPALQQKLAEINRSAEVTSTQEGDIFLNPQQIMESQRTHQAFDFQRAAIPSP